MQERYKMGELFFYGCHYSVNSVGVYMSTAAIPGHMYKGGEERGERPLLVFCG